MKTRTAERPSPPLPFPLPLSFPLSFLQRVLFHLMKDIVNVVSFGDALILVIGTHPGEQISYKAFVYSPSSAIDVSSGGA